MVVLIVRIALTMLAVGFLAWLGYIIYLGLKSFFGKDNDLDNADHRKQRGRTAPNKAVNYKAMD